MRIIVNTVALLAFCTIIHAEEPSAFVVSGRLLGVPKASIVRIEPAEGTCCTACKDVCGSGCDKGSCQNGKCCTLTRDVDQLGGDGSFRFLVEPGDYRILLVEGRSKERMVEDKIPVHGNLKLKDIIVPLRKSKEKNGD